MREIPNKKNYSLNPMVLTRNFCLILFNFYCFFAIDSFFILKCACLGASKYLIYIRNDVFQQSATCKIRNFLSIRLNNSDPLGDTKTSKFSPYNFSQYNFRKLIWPWSAQFTNLFLRCSTPIPCLTLQNVNFLQKSHICEEGYAHLRISFWHLLMKSCWSGPIKSK